jgi:LysR family hydrogen peroxide-inducible transcriptional activator
VVQCVIGGLGCTLVPISAVAAECDRPGVALATFDGGAATAGRTVNLSYRSSSNRDDAFRTIGGIVTGAFESGVGANQEVLEARLSPGSPGAH